MLQLLRSLAKNRRLLKDFVVRDLKARYVGSSMGFFWSVVFPIINLFVFMFVFRLILKARWSDHQGPIEVALVMLGGIVVWAAFAETVSRATNSLVENANLIQKVVFPSEILPLYLTLSSLINMCIGLPVVILCTLWFGYLAPPEVTFFEGARQWNEAQGETILTVHLARGSNRDVLIPFEVSGSATAGEDYEVSDSPVRIPSGQLVGGIRLRPVADSLADGGESVTLTLGDPEGAKLGEFPALAVTLSDSDPALLGTEDPQTVAARAALVKIDPTYKPLQLGFPLLSLPLLFILQTLFTAGLGYFLATFNLFLRDTFHLVGVFITVWMFSTPIFYPAEMVRRANYGLILDCNPMYWLIDSYRAALLYAQWPDLWLLGRFAAVSVVVFLAGSSFFMAQKKRIPDLL